MKRIVVRTVDMTKRKRMSKRRVVLSKGDVMTRSFQSAVDKAVQVQQENNLPVAKYDLERNQVYYLYADGSREYEEA